MTACIFVDGENFRHNIAELFREFRPEDYLPKHADWTGLFNWTVEQVTGESKRLRTYWYVIQSVDYSPYQLSKLAREPDKAYKVLSRHAPYKARLDHVGENSWSTEISIITQELEGRQSSWNRRFEGWKTIQDGIASRHDGVEFRRAGAIKYDLFTGRLGQEKAVDVKLAVDLVALRESYDTAIVVSGDQDYVPAVQMVKDSGKRVVNIAFRTRSGRQLPGGSRRLNQVTDSSLVIDFDSFSSFLRVQ